ncbi:hypothetical protein HQ590_10050 [bacterium]|nr:hypothetical protein [bacterium]
MTIRAHFDGTVIVPDEPVNLPANTALAVDIRPALTTGPADAATITRRLQGLKQFIAHGVRGATIPDEALRREHLYDDRT